MSAYLIFHYTIKDQEAIEKLDSDPGPYESGEFTGKIIVGSPMQALTGEAKQHVLIVEFDSLETAETFYNTDEHKRFMKKWNAATDGWAAIVPDVEGTSAYVVSRGLG